jgi:hypothetical protein
MKNGLFTVNYEGWLTVSAQDEDQAMAIVNEMLAKSGIVNDGDSGEWNLADVEDNDYYSN